MVDDRNDIDELNLNIEGPEKESGPGLIAKIKEKISLKLVIIISVVGALVAGGTVAFILLTGGEKIAEEPGLTEDTKSEELIMSPPVILFDDIVTLDVVEIKLSDLGGEKLFSVGIHCKIDQQDLRDELQKKDADVREIITVIMKSKTYAELQGVDGKILLRNEMIKHLNEILETGRIMNLFFYEYIIL